jgi:hypothetical protein
MGLLQRDPGARAVCARIAERIRAEKDRILERHAPASRSSASFHAVVQLEVAAVLAENPSTIGQALDMLPAPLAAECRAMI